jgi:hypothetical protein
MLLHRNGLSATGVEQAAALDNAAAVVRHHGPALVTVRTARQESGVGTAWLVLRVFTFRNY